MALSPHAPQPTWHPEGCTLGYVMQHQYATSLRDLDTRWLGGGACVYKLCLGNGYELRDALLVRPQSEGRASTKVGWCVSRGRSRIGPSCVTALSNRKR